MNRNKIIKDTLRLTAIDLAVQGMSLALNIFITRKLGAEATGTISLIGTFFTFAALISSVNIFLCLGRLISEEIGKNCGNPDRIFRYGLRFSLIASSVSAFVIFVSAPLLGERILNKSLMIPAIRILSFTLPLNAISSCIKGYLNAYRKASLSAVGGTIEFIVKSAVFALLAEFAVSTGKTDIFTAFSVSIFAGQIVSVLFFTALYLRLKEREACPASISFKSFIAACIPIILNSLVTAVLSSANDALVPITLMQYGNSTSQALSQFGIFEAIVIPALFFPSGILCSLSCLLIPEFSREKGAGNMKRTAYITNIVLRHTFSFSIFTAAFFLYFGSEIGFLMSGDYFAGKIIRILAPAVPFIYLEIILEAILKGMGKHSFSSINYIAEYAIRISVLLIFVPIFGFYGIVASYLASNIICNSSRIIMIIKITRIRFSLMQNIIIPVFSAAFSLEAAAVLEKLTQLSISNTIAETAVYTAVSAIIYILIQKLIYRICSLPSNALTSL